MKETRPLLTTVGDEEYGERKSWCNRKVAVISVIVFCAVALTLILVLLFAVDWSGDEEEGRRSNEYWQMQFLDLPSNESCKEISIALASKPHIAGYPEQEETGDYVAQFLEDVGIDKVMKQEWRDTVLDHFVSSELRMSINENEWVILNISEEAIESDNDTYTEYASHIWNAYSANGSVVGNVIYINYGRRRDYEELINNENITSVISNASYVGKIGLVRYGEMGRATKVKIAQEYGIIGLLMFSDPMRYAKDQEMVYPNGPWLPPSGVQRGSTKFASCPGNPNITRMQEICGIETMEEAIPSIPVMPLSYGNAEILFGNMEDAEIAPDGWQGGIDIDYKVSSEELRINLNVETDLRFDDLTQNVYGMIEGDEFPEQIVMIGAHRDSWVYGAQDDVSGTTTILEVAKGFGTLYRRGWRPRRSVIFASWDSEESGLIGSCNLGEIMKIDDLVLDDGLIAYLNLDMTTGGDTFEIAGNPLLRRVSEEAMQFTPIRNPRFPDIDTFYDYQMNQNGSWGILGQGSDHTVFAFHLGITAMDMGFGGDTAWGAYHSMYDTLKWQETVDGNWMLAEDIARLTGILTMKLVDNKVIPFDLEILANTMKEWYIGNLMEAMVTYDCDPNDFITDNNVTDELLVSLNEFETVAIELNDYIIDLANRTNSESSDSSDSNDDDNDDNESDNDLVDKFNDLLGMISKQFMSSDGLPERIWHKNILWNTAIEDGPYNVFPYIWYSLQYECNEDMLRESFDITQNIVDGATEILQDYLSNVTQSVML